MKEELKALGLNDTDINVYLASLEIGEAVASEIASKARIPRASIYDVLDRLIQRGLIGYVVKGYNKYFTAADPNTIIMDLEYKKSRIIDILPQLTSIQNKKYVDKPKTEVYDGKRGAETIFNMMLSEKIILAMGGSRKTSKILPYFMPKWNRERKKKNIVVKMIYHDTTEIRRNVEESKEGLQPIEYRFLHTDYLSPVLTIIFGDRVMLGLWHDEPSSILIESSEIADTYKQYFQKLWKIAKK